MCEKGQSEDTLGFNEASAIDNKPWSKGDAVPVAAAAEPTQEELVRYHYCSLTDRLTAHSRFVLRRSVALFSLALTLFSVALALTCRSGSDSIFPDSVLCRSGSDSVLPGSRSVLSLCSLSPRL